MGSADRQIHLLLFDAFYRNECQHVDDKEKMYSWITQRVVCIPSRLETASLVLVDTLTSMMIRQTLGR